MLVISGVLLFITPFIAFTVGNQLSTNLSVGEFPKACKETKPVSSDYEEQGKIWNLEDLPIYETEDGTPKKILVLAYDIFGFHPNTFQVADKLAKEGKFRVVIPDYFRGQPFPEDKYPIKDMADLYEFVNTKGNWEKNIKADTIKVVEHYKAPNTTFAIFGICWGGMVAAASAGQLADLFKVSAMVHPSLITEELANNVQIPTYLMTCAGDPDLVDFYIKIQQNLGNRCGYKRFTDVHHGFVATRGNFSDPIVQARVDEVLAIVTHFFNANL